MHGLERTNGAKNEDFYELLEQAKLEFERKEIIRKQEIIDRAYKRLTKEPSLVELVLRSIKEYFDRKAQYRSYKAEVFLLTNRIEYLELKYTDKE